MNERILFTGLEKAAFLNRVLACKITAIDQFCKHSSFFFRIIQEYIKTMLKIMCYNKAHLDNLCTWLFSR